MDAPVQAESAASPQADRSAAAPAAAPKPVQARKLIRTVELELEVRDTDGVARKVQALAGRAGGYVAAVSAQRQEEVVYYTITLRVPVDRFDAVLAEIKGLALRVDREQQQVQDVTDQFVDLGARRRSLEATEVELQALLAESRQKARKVDEIMAVYRELTEIRTQIEQIQGQMNSLDKLAALSTLNVSLRPVESARPVTSQGWRPSDTVRGSLRTLLGFLRGLADVAIFTGIVVLPVLLLLWGLFRLLRPVFRRARRPQPPPPGGGPSAPSPG